jgi:predicted Zn-ribbon and HTH transcriptional regulator
MSLNESIADKIEEGIGKMFHAFSKYEPKISEYSLYYDSKKYPSWFIELFFSKSKHLNEALENGTCYDIHRYLTSELDNVAELRDVNIIIYFEFGNRPTNETVYLEHYEKLVEKTQRQTEPNIEIDSSICKSCGHNFDKHQLKGNIKEETNALKEGWIICPEENCNCFLTWDANYNEIE